MDTLEYKMKHRFREMAYAQCESVCAFMYLPKTVCKWICVAYLSIRSSLVASFLLTRSDTYHRREIKKERERNTFPCINIDAINLHVPTIATGIFLHFR